MNKSIASILALAVTTSLAFANGGGDDEKKKNPYSLKNTGWTPGSGITVIDDDAMSMHIGGRIQAGFQYDDYNEAAELDGYSDVATFDVERARVKMSGHIVNEHLTYLLQLEATNNFDNVKDAWAHWNFWNNEGNHIGVRLGQGKPYYGLEASGSSAALWFTDRSLATEVFSNLRSTGAIFTGHHMENKLRWSAGLQNGTVAAASTFDRGDSYENQDTQLNIVAHVSFDPLGDMMNGGSNLNFKQGDLAHNGELKGTVGLGYAKGNNTYRTLAGTAAVNSNSYNVNSAWRFGNGLSAQAEFFGRTDEEVHDTSFSEDSDGYYAQVGYSMAHNPDAMVQWGFGLRYSMIDLQANPESPGNTTFMAPNLVEGPGTISDISIVATAFYTGHNAKTQIQYSMGEYEPDAGGDNLEVDEISVLFTLVF
ncbi:MAG: hypothetical protein VYE77_05815 [Planctomycetota bacterium]|nr:hypothetical protein [Planctomycetota bacterium]